MSKPGNLIGGILFGGLLFLSGFPLLWWNEGRAVKTARSLNEGEKECVSIENTTINGGNEGKLVHTSGNATTDQVLEDTEFGISANAIKLQRVVEMYQWTEDEDRDDEDNVTYSYKQQWRSELVDSSRFHHSGHDNPRSMPVGSNEFVASHVALGGFRLSKTQVGKLNDRTQLPLNDEFLAKLPEKWRSRLSLEGEGYYLATRRPTTTPDAAAPAEADAPASSDTPTNAEPSPAEQPPADQTPADQTPADQTPADQTPADQTSVDQAPAEQPPVGEPAALPRHDAAPEIGDVRIRFNTVQPADITIVSQQAGESFQPYQTQAGDALDMLRPGLKSKEQMFEMARTDNLILTWVLRVVGFFMMFFGMAIFASPVSRVASFVPVVGNIVNAGILLVAGGLAAGFSLITIALAWLFFRPVLGIALLILAGAAIVGIVMLIKARNTGQKQPGMVV